VVQAARRAVVEARARRELVFIQTLLTKEKGIRKNEKRESLTI
jgi:hypothetical protein